MGVSTIVLVSAASFVAFLLYLKFRKSQNMKYFNLKSNLIGKVIVITGANAGLGKELCFELARRGAEIVMACRDLNKANLAIENIKKRLADLPADEIETSSKSVLHASKLDLSNLTSVNSFVEEFKQKFSRLHILVNNAGMMGGDFRSHESGIELQYVTNHLGHFHLTNQLLDVLRKSEPSRIIIVSSGYYRRAKLNDLSNLKWSTNYQPLMAYARSKLANCLHGVALSNRLKAEENVVVYVLRPGFVRGTELGRNFSRLHTCLLYPILWFFSKSVHQGVQTYLYCCLNDTNKMKSGCLYNDCRIDDGIRFDLINEDAAEKLWTQSEIQIRECLAAEQLEF